MKEGGAGRFGALLRPPLSPWPHPSSATPGSPALRALGVILLPVMMSAPFFPSARRALRHALLVTAGVTAMTACGGALPAARTPGAAPVASAPVDLLATPWRLGNGRAVRTQRIEVLATLTSRVDSLVRTDSVASDLVVTWGDDARSTSAPIPIRVTRYAVRVAPDTTYRVPPGVTGDFVLSATPQPSGIPALCREAAPGCSAANIAAAQGWQESWLGLPSALEPGTTWRDSTVYTVLRDSIPLAVTSVRDFTVREAFVRDGAVVVVVDRRSTQRLVGEGSQFGEPVRITGSGEGVMRLEVALENGAVLRGDGTSMLTLELVGRRRSQSLTQESHLTITAP